MTEDEARVRWCPFARPIYQGSSPDGTLCIASACMAWRTRTMSQVVRAAMFRDERRLHPQMTDDELWSKVNRYDLPDGYCGLAGAPL